MATGKTVLAVVVIVVVALAGIAGYGVGTLGAGHSTITTTATVSTGGINQTLVTLAKAEGGSVTCYCVMDTGDWPTFNKILTQEFPWMHVNYVGLDPGDIASRAKTEFQAGHVQADILVDSQPALQTLKPIGALRPWCSPEAVLNNFSGIDPACYMQPVFGLPIVLIWNTNLVKDNSTLPKNWFDIANPQWKGKLGIDDPSTLNLAGPLFASLGGSTTNQSFINWLHQVKANNPVLGASAGDIYTDVASGQLSIGLGYLNDVLGANASTPIAWKTIGSSFYTSPVTAVLTQGATHPYAAELLLEWLQSYSGQVAFALTGRTPVMSVVASQYFASSIPLGTSLIPMAENTNMYVNGTEWSNFYTGIFGP